MQVSHSHVAQLRCWQVCVSRERDLLRSGGRKLFTSGSGDCLVCDLATFAKTGSASCTPARKPSMPPRTATLAPNARLASSLQLDVPIVRFVRQLPTRRKAVRVAPLATQTRTFRLIGIHPGYSWLAVRVAPTCPATGGPQASSRMGYTGKGLFQLDQTLGG